MYQPKKVPTVMKCVNLWIVKQIFQGENDQKLFTIAKYCK